MIVTLILILLIIVFMAFFIGMNLSNVCTFWFFKTYTDLPVAVLTLIAFGAGKLLPAMLKYVLKKNLKKNREQKKKSGLPRKKRLQGRPKNRRWKHR